MLSSTPLIPKSKPDKKCNYAVYVICLTIIAAVLYFAYTDTGMDFTNSTGQRYFAQQTAETENILETDDPEEINMIEISYNVQDLVAFAGKQKIFPRSPIWNKFHETLIVSAGYDPEIIKNDPHTMVNFHAHDHDEYVSEIDTVQFDRSVYASRNKESEDVTIYIDHDDVLYLNSVRNDFAANMDYQRTLVEAAGYDFDDDDLIYKLKVIPNSDRDDELKANCGGCGCACRGTCGPKPTKAPKTKKPKPTKAPKTPRPAKTPKPAKTPRPAKPGKTPRTKPPKPTKAPTTPKPTKSPTPDPFLSGMHCYTSFNFLDSCTSTDDYANCYMSSDRFARCGRHQEFNGISKIDKILFKKVWGDDRTGCMGIWADSDQLPSEFTGVRSGIYALSQYGSYTYTKPPLDAPLSSSDHRSSGYYYKYQGCAAKKQRDESWTGKWVGVGARCCILPNPTEQYFAGSASETSFTHYMNPQLAWSYHDRDTRCHTLDCDEETNGFGIALGCAGSAGTNYNDQPYTTQFSGQVQRGNKCHTERNDDGWGGVYGICGNVVGGDISCTQVYSDSATKLMENVYISESQCPSGTSITDCNGYVHGNIDTCSSSPFESQDRVNGEMIDNGKCVAVGNTNKVRSQSNCCKVEYTN